MKKKGLLLAAILMAVLCIPAQGAEDDDFGIWTAVTINKGWDKFYATGRVEYRSKENASQLDQFILRAVAGYKISPWLKADAGYDHIKGPSSEKNRLLLSATATLKSGNLKASVRERYIRAWTVGGNASNVLRSKLKVQYSIQQSIVSPYLAVEMFTWDKWNKTRHYAGAEIGFGKFSKVDVFYMYYTFDGKSAEHVAGLTYSFSF